MASPRSLFVPALLGLVLAASSLAGQDPGQERTRERRRIQGQEESPVSEMQRALQQIGGYHIAVEGWSRRPAAASKNLTETINPFRVRKRGRYYGSIYEFHRNDNLDARNFFDPVGEPLPEFKRNQFGGSFGATLTSRLKVFATYDGLRIIQGSTILSHVPTPAERRGDFSAREIPLIDPLTGEPFPGNQIPQSRLHPVSLGLLPTIPDPVLSDLNRNFINSQPRIENVDSLGFRTDYEWSGNRKIFAEYRRSSSNRFNVDAFPTFGSSIVSTHHDLSLNYNWTLSEKIVAAFAVNVRRSVELELSPHSGRAGLVSSLGINGITAFDELDEGYPDVRIAGYGGGGGATLGDEGNVPRGQAENLLELRAGLNQGIGDHNLGFGAELDFEQLNNARSQALHRGRFTFNGDFTGEPFADFLLGIPDSAVRGVGSERGDVRGRRWRFYLRDDWKLAPQFSLSFALAYNYFEPHRSLHDNISFFHPLLFVPPAEGEIVVSGSRRAAELGLGGLASGQGVFPDRNDWEPRLGLAYSPFGNNKLVLRASYQMGYNALTARRLLPWFGKNFPFFYQEISDSSPLIPEIDFSDPFQSVTPTELTIRALDPYLRNEIVHDWNLTIQNEIVRNWTLEVSYVGRKQDRIAQVIYGNSPPAGAGSIQDRRPNPAYGRFEIGASRGSSIGHSLQARLVKRLARGFSIRSSFSWNRTFSDRFGGQPSNPFNLRGERALAGQPPLRFSVNYLLELPFGKDRRFGMNWLGRFRGLVEGWRLSGITSLVSGRPFQPQLPGDLNNDGLTADRPDRLGEGNLPSSMRSVDRWFATEDFSLPAPFTYGNAGRSILFGPGEQVWDLSLSKLTTIGDGKTLEFRVEFFNAFNHANFNQPVSTFGTSVFGRIFGAHRAREIEIALKYSF